MIVVISSMKLTDPIVKRRVHIAELFRSVDVLSQGTIKHTQFRKVYDSLAHDLYINTKSRKQRFEEIVKVLDPLNKGKIDMNAFIEWMDIVSIVYTYYAVTFILIV